jgi:tRNA threonylcarbamoyladenosine modification (KEOPS) complex  Pcc1 subunit
MAARATAKPRSREEEAIVNSRLRKKYPQMYTENWAKRVKKAVQAELKQRRKRRTRTSKKTDRVSSQLRKAGLSAKEVARLRGK